MTPLGSRFQQLKEDLARRAAEWDAARAALGSIPADVRCAVPERLLEDIDRAAETPKRCEPLVAAHQLRA